MARMIDRLMMGLARAGIFRGLQTLGSPRLSVFAYHRFAVKAMGMGRM